jgi:RND family efflux transporter MFP subunit
MKPTLSVWFRLAVSGLLLATGCHRSPTAARGPAPLPTAAVRVAPVRAVRSAILEPVVGTTQARQRASLEAKVSGRIERLDAVPGHSVTNGQLLVELDEREIQARLDQALAVRHQAESELKRFSTLLEQQAVTQAEFDAAQARQRVAVAAVAEAETLKTYTRVRAPFGGTVVRKLAEVGDLAAPGRPLIELEDPNTLRLEADVPEKLQPRIQPGAHLAVRLDALPSPIEGTVSEVAPAADPGSRTFRVKVDLPPAPGLLTGQFGRLFVPLGERDSLRVPVSAIVFRGQMELAFVITNRIAQLRLVKTGKSDTNEIEVLAGLSAGDSVVVEGAAVLEDGQPVQLP